MFWLVFFFYCWKDRKHDWKLLFVYIDAFGINSNVWIEVLFFRKGRQRSGTKGDLWSASYLSNLPLLSQYSTTKCAALLDILQSLFHPFPSSRYMRNCVASAWWVLLHFGTLFHPQNFGGMKGWEIYYYYVNILRTVRAQARHLWNHTHFL